MTRARTGRCLCGAVTFEATPAPSDDGLHVDACHCGMCRRQVGGPLMTVPCERVTPAESEDLGVYRSSDWAERGFCRRCGSNLFFRMLDGSFCAVNAGALDDLSDARFTMEIFIDDKPSWYSFAQHTNKLTGAEVRALFAGEE